MGDGRGQAAGRGGIAAVVRATDVGESTVRRGLEELERRERLERGRVRRAGAGDKPLRETSPGIEEDLEQLLEDSARGDPDSPLRWTSKSAAKLAAGLVAFGHHVSAITVARPLSPRSGHPSDCPWGQAPGVACRRSEMGRDARNVAKGGVRTPAG